MQASKNWNKRYDVSVKENEFAQNPKDSSEWKKVKGSKIVFTMLYMDGILLIGNSITMMFAVQ